MKNKFINGIIITTIIAVFASGSAQRLQVQVQVRHQVLG